MIRMLAYDIWELAFCSIGVEGWDGMERGGTTINTHVMMTTKERAFEPYG